MDGASHKAATLSKVLGLSARLSVAGNRSFLCIGDFSAASQVVL